MRSRDLTLSASLIGSYIAITVLVATTPFKLGGFLLSALFGIFWNYFTLKQNLTFQAGRLAYNVAQGFYVIPRIAAQTKIQATVGYAFLNWVNSTGYPIDSTGLRIVEIMGQGDPTVAFYSFYVIGCLCHVLILPYAFFRYFKRIGIFKRLPSF